MLHIARLIERRFPARGGSLVAAMLTASALLAAAGATLLATQ
ncbi:MAG TPA: hypothetical protein VM619_05815 [Luteimonas sp.]|nr:hypothetical protein [Luteimonas sp.]